MADLRTVPTWFASVWIAGDHQVALQACREFCQSTPLCVTVTPTTYVYVGGAEDGVCVRLINYPRFPELPGAINTLAKMLAEHLCKALCQQSYTIETPQETVWTSYRKDR